MVIPPHHHKNLQALLFVVTIAFMAISIWHIYDTRKMRKEELALKKEDLKQAA